MTESGSVVPVQKAPSAAAREWLDFTRRLGEIGARVHEIADPARTDRQRPEINEALMLMLCKGILFERQLDPDKPEWVPWMNNALRDAVANADNCYHIARIRGSGIYRMAGNRGTASRVETQISQGFYGFPGQGPLLGSFTLDDFDIAKDADFSIILSAERPEGHSGPWIRLDPEIDDIFLFLRNITYDWKTERHGPITIENIGPGPLAPPRSLAIEHFGETASGFLERMMDIHLAILEDQEYDTAPLNEIRDCTARFAGQNILNEQRYFGGKLKFGADQAMIIEFTAPDPSVYWLAQMLDSYANSLEQANAQISLNQSSAVVDADGKVRLVIAEKDPGVPNWLDKGDYEENWIRIRAYKADVPPLTVTVVPFSQVRAALPAETGVITPAERRAAMIERAAAVQMRRRW